MTPDDLTPPQRVEVQEFWLRRYLKAADFRTSGRPERRRKPWPRTARWWQNDAQTKLARQLATRDAALTELHGR